MKWYNLSQQEQATGLGATHRLTITYADLDDTAATSATLQLFPETDGATLPAGTVMEVILCKVVTAFVGASITVLTLKIGDGSDDDRLMTTTFGDLLTATTRAVTRAVTTQPYAFASADTIDGVVTATGANLTALTAGQVDVYFRLVPPGVIESAIVV